MVSAAKIGRFGGSDPVDVRRLGGGMTVRLGDTPSAQSPRLDVVR